MDLQVGGTSIFRVEKANNVRMFAGASAIERIVFSKDGTFSYLSISNILLNNTGGANYGWTGNTRALNATGVSLLSTDALQWTDSTTFGSVDLVLRRQAADTLAQRRGTNKQRSEVFGTFTDASNFRRFYIDSTTAGAFTIGVEGLGNGASGNTLTVANALTVSGDLTATGNISAAAITASGAFNLAPITKAALLALTPTAATGGRWRVTDSVPAQRNVFPDGTVWRYSDNNKDVNLADEVTYTPGGTTQTIPLNDGPTQTLLLSSATGTVTTTLTIPSQPGSGRIIVRQGATPRLVTLAVSSGTLVLLGAALPLDAADTMRVYSWTYDGTRTIVGPSEVSV